MQISEDTLNFAKTRMLCEFNVQKVRTFAKIAVFLSNLFFKSNHLATSYCYLNARQMQHLEFVRKRNDNFINAQRKQLHCNRDITRSNITRDRI